MNPIKSISYSKYSLWCQCPQRFKYSYIDKFKEPPSPILERGTQLHKEAMCDIKLDVPIVVDMSIGPNFGELEELKYEYNLEL